MSGAENQNTTATASSPDNIRRRIEARIGQGEFIAGLLRVAGRESSAVQRSFVDRLSHIAAMMRDLLEQNGMIRRLSYRPREFWPQQKGRSIAFIDGGVANIDLPSAAPLGIRVGSYIVRPGDETENRERFNIELSLVDDLFSPDGEVFDDDFIDTAKLRDTARMTSETAAAYRLARSVQPPDIILLHGPLVNPVAPYGLEGFPSFGQTACRVFCDDESFDGNEEARQFVALYLDLLRRIEQTGRPVVGVVERSVGRDPVVIRRILNRLQDQQHLKRDEARDILQEVTTYGLNDSSLFDVVLEDGEYVTPMAVDRQGPENKWPDRWKQWIRDYPPALTTYLKPSATVVPFRVEGFESTPDFESALDLILHTSRLLPSYGFPVGLDIVDKFAKVPAWMSHGVKGQHQVVLLRKALESGDPRVVTFAKRVLAAKGRDWWFRPSA
ncbi:MAG: DNA double-strand break repair nuclease NurA [Variibacter sp.]